ncbi:hypothetical protein [Pelagerythrobacter marinus]|jgi:peptidoglycan/LPS O-acetylase OafA/YrhL|uniref:Uncharacterized protein n=1 Tax=Pelagerythrobacter marinus TaxID=538382 RepID=A0ABW9UYK2_9SPHN|nr:hypothetical protein [Pelagerythrobacter marinus]MEC9068263.1 hypothetical protein [Pseudomonadota bacterium]MXO68893.1 hypothetical protein [Pelagerythrobacter marinus]USA39194.1 hypothetical protein NCF86_12980 [Pelagerythrobacter marinus]WPZ06719.1 hypothetical protein T8T98_15125 [Pelagerythrobacter marinus]
MVPPSPLDDPDKAAFAWARYKRLMRAMVLVTLVVVALVLAYLYLTDSAHSFHFYIATALGVGATMMLTAALMGLVFLSSGTGHDESVTDLTEDERER